MKRKTPLLITLSLIFPLSANALLGTSAPFSCVGGTMSHAATQSEANAVTDGSIIAGFTQVCPDDAAQGISNEVGSAKEYLYNISTKVNTADKYHISQLNDKFAVCAAMYAKAYTQQFGETLQITSAWRSAADQKRVSTSPTSNHTRGLAIDIHPASRSQASYDRMRDFAAQNKQFGVCFARPMYNGSPDRPHMTAAGIGSRTEDCAKYGITQMCNGGGAFNPNQVSDSSPPQQTQTPTSSFTDALRGYLGGQQPTGTQTPSAGAIPSSSQPYTPAQSSTIATPAGSGVSTNPGVTTSATPVTSAVPTTIAGGTTAEPTAVSSQIGAQQTSGTSGSTYDLLSALAYPTAATTAIATGSPIALNDNLSGSVGGVEYQGSQTVQLQGSLSGDVYALQSQGQQTFTSQDLQYSPGSTYAPPQNTSLQQRVLESLRQALLKLLEMVRPFGYVQPQQGDELQGE